MITHSGLQLGGEPMYPCKQEQAGFGPLAWHCEFGPHGEGWHGSRGLSTGVTTTGAKKRFNLLKNNKLFS